MSSEQQHRSHAQSAAVWQWIQGRPRSNDLNTVVEAGEDSRGALTLGRTLRPESPHAVEEEERTDADADKGSPHSFRARMRRQHPGLRELSNTTAAQNISDITPSAGISATASQSQQEHLGRLSRANTMLTTAALDNFNMSSGQTTRYRETEQESSSSGTCASGNDTVFQDLSDGDDDVHVITVGLRVPSLVSARHLDFATSDQKQFEEHLQRSGMSTTAISSDNTRGGNRSDTHGDRLKGKTSLGTSSRGRKMNDWYAAHKKKGTDL